MTLEHYPAIERYLSQFKEDLQPKPRGQGGKGRKSGSYKWYEIQDSVDYYSKFDLPKIISVRFGLQNGFVYDEKGFYTNNATSFFSPGKKWLTAVLNSSVCNLCLISICPSVQNGYTQFFLDKMALLPIIEPSQEGQVRLAVLVDQLQALGGQGPEVTLLEREVDAIIYQTYDLTNEEITEIERWHADRRTQLGAGRRKQQTVVDEEGEA